MAISLSEESVKEDDDGEEEGIREASSPVSFIIDYFILSSHTQC